MRLNELFYRLDEGRKEQFMAMMPAPFLEIESMGGKTWKDKWSEEVNWALTTLKKQDRIVWYLRLVKGIMLHYLLTLTNNNQYTELKDLAKKEVKKIENIYSPEVIAKTNLTTIESHLEHFLSLNLPAIDKIVWTNQSPKDLIDQMAVIEKDWKEKQKSTIPHAQAQRDSANIIETFPNGWEWVNLNKSQCDVEGKAMGHCGNAGNPSESDTILSLREPVKNGWMPHLTFILDKETGMLGEMKGRGNQKPAAKYHSYIIALLKKPFIKGITGGGYLPQNNFSVNDLTPEQQEELFKVKPRLATFTYRYKKSGISEELIADLDRKLAQYHFGFMADYDKKVGVNGGFVIGIQEPDWFAERDRSFEYYYKILQMGFIEDMEIGDSDPLYFLENLDDAVYEKIKAYVEKTYFDNTPNDDLDLDDRRDVYKFLNSEDDELINEFRKAVDQGYQTGTYEEIYKAIQEYLNEPVDYNKTHFPESGGVGTLLDNVDKDIQEWTTIFWITAETMFSWADNDTFDEISDWDSLYADYLKDFEHSVPQNGFWDFDKKSANEYFIDEHPEFSVTVEKK